MKKLLLPILAVCCLAPAAAFAAQQHPLATDMAQTVEPGKFEAETALAYFTDKNGGVKVSGFQFQETVTGGIIPKLDALIALPYTSYKVDGGPSESGIGDIIVGAKYNFMNIDKITLSAKPFVVLPTGDDKKGLGFGGVGVGVVGIASMELDKGIALDGNLSLKRQATSGDSFNEFGLSVAGKYEVNKELKAVAELATAKADVDGAKWETFVTAGAIYAVQGNIDVDAGIRLGLTSDTQTTQDLGIALGLTYKF